MTVEAVKVAWQPASQSWPMETKDVSPREGKRWTRLAFLGSPGIGSSAVCVEIMELLSGSLTVKGSETGCL